LPGDVLVGGVANGKSPVGTRKSDAYRTTFEHVE